MCQLLLFCHNYGPLPKTAPSSLKVYMVLGPLQSCVQRNEVTPKVQQFLHKPTSLCTVRYVCMPTIHRTRSDSPQTKHTVSESVRLTSQAYTQTTSRLNVDLYSCTTFHARISQEAKQIGICFPENIATKRTENRRLRVAIRGAQPFQAEGQICKCSERRGPQVSLHVAQRKKNNTNNDTIYCTAEMK